MRNLSWAIIALSLLVLPAASHARDGEDLLKVDLELLKAAKKGNAVKVEELLDRGASLYAADRRGRTALDLAKQKGRADVVNVIEARMEDIAFEAARTQDTPLAYETFLRDFPDRRHAAAANTLLSVANERIEIARRKEEIARRKEEQAAQQRKVTGQKANALENRIMNSPSEANKRYVIRGMPVSVDDQYGRGAQKATIKKFDNGNVAIIGQYWEDDGDLVLPGGLIFSTRRGGYFQVGLHGLHYGNGQARWLDESEKLADILPNTAGSVHRFIGEIRYRDYTFEGAESSPLTFGLLDNVGYVYLHGNGVVTLEDGTQVHLGK